jgi:uncharacterized protein YcbK (DUF882 family)
MLRDIFLDDANRRGLVSVHERMMGRGGVGRYPTSGGAAVIAG